MKLNDFRKISAETFFSVVSDFCQPLNRWFVNERVSERITLFEFIELAVFDFLSRACGALAGLCGADKRVV